MAILRTTQYTKIAQDSARLACNIMYLLYAKDEASDWRVELMTYVNLLASVASILLAGMVAIMKNAVLKEIEANKGTAADINDAEEGHGDGNGDSIEMLTIEYSENPMHNSSSGAGLVKITGFDPNMNVRAFLVKLLPEIDGPSVHAVDLAFKEDGVETMRDLLSYLEGGVLGMTDLKNYSKQGKLDMSQTLKLSRAVEHLLEERMKSDDESHNGSALATPGRRPRKIVAWSGHSSEKEKGQLGRIKKVIANAVDSITDAFEVVSNIEKDILVQDEDNDLAVRTRERYQPKMPLPEEFRSKIHCYYLKMNLGDVLIRCSLQHQRYFQMFFSLYLDKRRLYFLHLSGPLRSLLC